jgi:hypothetical protein
VLLGLWFGRVNDFSWLTIPSVWRFVGHTAGRRVVRSAASADIREIATTEIDEISARLTVLETVVRQLITHKAVRADDPAGWVQTRRTLAMSAIEPDGPVQAESVTSEYSGLSRPGTPRPFLR